MPQRRNNRQQLFTVCQPININSTHSKEGYKWFYLVLFNSSAEGYKWFYLIHPQQVEDFSKLTRTQLTQNRPYMLMCDMLKIICKFFSILFRWERGDLDPRCHSWKH